MAMTRHWRSRTPVRFYAAIGEGALEGVEALSLEPGIQRVMTPRAATLLLIAGRIPEPAWPALRRLHEQLPHPRASLYWGVDPQPIPDAVSVASHDPPAAELRMLQKHLLLGDQPSSEALLPNEPPAPWRGQGSHGQGGEGMMGGKPYGRPMSMSAEDVRDGLALDAHRVSLGPFAPMLPPGLCLRLTLQGDVIQGAEILAPPYADPASLAPFQEARRTSVPIGRLERARAAHHLRCVARLLAIRGASALAARTLRTARRVSEGEPVHLGGLRRWLRLSGLSQGIEPGLGLLDQVSKRSLQGPALRASGEAADLRVDLDPYRGVGFQPITQPDGDVRARIEQWLAEAAQSLTLDARLGAELVHPGQAIEGPSGPLGPNAGERAPLAETALDRLLRGLEWSQAMTVLASFDANSLRRLLGRKVS